MSMLIRDIEREYRLLPLFSDGREMYFRCPSAVKNMAKNRYSDVLPDEVTRFTVDGNPDFYYNANVVFGGIAIAAQGPRPRDRQDFWNMVWNSNSAVIIMLTNFREKNKDKCSKYWPTGERTYGDITITSCEKKRLYCFPGYRECIIKRIFVAEKGGEKRVLHHYHLQNWPDWGVARPETVSALIRHVSLHNCDEKSPMIVHCSAGVGRTGVFLAAYAAWKDSKAGSMSSGIIGKKARQLRNERNKSISTFEQYVLIYKVLQQLSEAN